MQFFMAMEPPTCTHQEKKIGVRKGKPYTYEPAELKDARAKLEAHLGRHAPAKSFVGAVEMTTFWCFPLKGKHTNGEYKISAPDVTNLQKLLEDVMTDLGFWGDDAQIASAVTKKFWASTPGIFIRIENIGDHREEE